MPGYSPPTDFAGFKLTAATSLFYPYANGDGPDLRSAASSTGGDELSVTLFADAAGRHAQDAGTYAYLLDPNNTHLKLTPVSDQCDARRAALSGDWTRSTCQENSGWCLGDLAAGEYRSGVFTPFMPATSWRYDYGEMSYTVPSGWSNPEGTPSGYRLEQQAAPEFTAICVFVDMLAHSQAPDCPAEPDPTVGTSAADLTDWLTGLDSIVNTKPKPVTIGGLPGATLDVSLDPAWTRTCPYSEGVPMAPLFSNADPGATSIGALAGTAACGSSSWLCHATGNWSSTSSRRTRRPGMRCCPDAMPVVNSFVFGQRPQS